MGARRKTTTPSAHPTVACQCHAELALNTTSMPVGSLSAGGALRQGRAPQVGHTRRVSVLSCVKHVLRSSAGRSPKRYADGDVVRTGIASMTIRSRRAAPALLASNPPGSVAISANSAFSRFAGRSRPRQVRRCPSRPPILACQAPSVHHGSRHAGDRACRCTKRARMEVTCPTPPYQDKEHLGQQLLREKLVARMLVHCWPLVTRICSTRWRACEWRLQTPHECSKKHPARSDLKSEPLNHHCAPGQTAPQQELVRPEPEVNPCARHARANIHGYELPLGLG